MTIYDSKGELKMTVDELNKTITSILVSLLALCDKDVCEHWWAQKDNIFDISVAVNKK